MLLAVILLFPPPSITARAVPFPSRGDSDKCDEFLVEHAASWLAALATAAGISSAVWVGHSVSSQYVLRLRNLRPELVRGLVLAAPTGEPGAFRWLAQLVGLARTSVREPLPLVGRVLSHYATTPPARTIGSWLGARRDDPLAGARACACPLRVVLGERDPVVPESFARRLAASAPQGDLVVIPGSAHGVALAPPEPFCRALLSFLERCAGEPDVIASLASSKRVGSD